MSRKENGRKLILFIVSLVVIVIVSVLLGLFVNANCYSIGNFILDLEKNAESNLKTIMLVLDTVTCVIDIVGIIVIITMCCILSKMVNSQDISDDGLDALETRVDLNASIVQIIFLSELAISIFCTCCNILNVEYTYVIFYFLVLFLTMVEMIVGCVACQKIMKLQNKLSPNVDLRVYDFKIMSVQEQQFDEAQRDALYKATYSTFKLCCNVFSILFVIFLLVTVVFDIPIFTVALLGAMVVFMNVVFLIKNYRAQHPKKKKGV